MIKNDIFEISHSPNVNSLTIIQKKPKPVHICVDARQVKKEMVPDRAKTPPAHKLLQWFNGAKYISSIGLNSTLASFIWVLQRVLGSDSTGYVLNYVDDIIVYSSIYKEQVKHPDTVFEKLKTAGFTINFDNCDFCRQR
jgi:hypothetical protein